jgi:hypothetical protein
MIEQYIEQAVEQLEEAMTKEPNSLELSNKASESQRAGRLGWHGMVSY